MLSIVVLVLLNLTTLTCLALAYGMTPADEHDREALDGAGAGALFAMGVGVPTLVVTILPVALRRLRPRWFVPPAVLLVLAVARYAYLVSVYDPW